MLKYRVVITDQSDHKLLDKSYDAMGNNNPFTSLLENLEFLEDMGDLKEMSPVNPKEWKWYFYQETPISGINIEEFTKEIQKEILYNFCDIDSICKAIHKHLKYINPEPTQEVKEEILKLIAVNL